MGERVDSLFITGGNYYLESLFFIFFFSQLFHLICSCAAAVCHRGSPIHFAILHGPFGFVAPPCNGHRVFYFSSRSLTTRRHFPQLNPWLILLFFPPILSLSPIWWSYWRTNQQIQFFFLPFFVVVARPVMHSNVGHCWCSTVRTLSLSLSRYGLSSGTGGGGSCSASRSFPPLFPLLACVCELEALHQAKKTHTHWVHIKIEETPTFWFASIVSPYTRRRRRRRSCRVIEP